MFTLKEITTETLRLVRDGEFASLGLCGADAGMPILTFCGNMKFLKSALKNPNVSCVMVPESFAETAAESAPSLGIIAAEDIRRDFFTLHNRLCAAPLRERYVGKDKPTVIGENCRIDPRAVIDDKNVEIGDRTVIGPNAVIFGNTKIGADCVIGAGSVLGGSGLEFIRLGDEGMLGVEHAGRLVIGDRVEIQYNCNVSRSLFPWHETRIGDDTKIESLVHIAHGSHLGKRVLAAASACVAGSAEVGDNVWIGPNATISSEVKVGNNARITLGAVVVSDVPAGTSVTGNFALPHEVFMMDHLRKMRGGE